MLPSAKHMDINMFFDSKQLSMFTCTLCPSKHLIQHTSPLNNNQVNINRYFIQTFGNLLTTCQIAQDSLEFQHHIQLLMPTDVNTI